MYFIRSYGERGWQDGAARYSDANEAIKDASKAANGSHTRVVSEADPKAGEKEHVIFDSVRDQ